MDSYSPQGTILGFWVLQVANMLFKKLFLTLAVSSRYCTYNSSDEKTPVAWKALEQTGFSTPSWTIFVPFWAFLGGRGDCILKAILLPTLPCTSVLACCFVKLSASFQAQFLVIFDQVQLAGDYHPLLLLSLVNWLVCPKGKKEVRNLCVFWRINTFFPIDTWYLKALDGHSGFWLCVSDCWTWPRFGTTIRNKRWF